MALGHPIGASCAPLMVTLLTHADRDVSGLVSGFLGGATQIAGGRDRALFCFCFCSCFLASGFVPRVFEVEDLE